MDEKKIRCGDIRVAMEEEPVIWMDRKRVTIFALPWSFNTLIKSFSSASLKIFVFLR